MPNKAEFIERCKENGISKSKALAAWKRIKNLENFIKTNWDFFQDMREFSRDRRLAIRQKAAEHGSEYTPDELDGLIDVIGIVQDNMDIDRGF